MRNEKCNYGDRCKFRHINREDNREYDEELNQKLNNDLGQKNVSNYYINEDRNRNWQNRNRGKERYNEGNPMYSESHNQIGQQYNDRSNGENYWYKDDYSNSDRYENENTIHQTFLERYPKKREVCTQIGTMMRNLIEEMAQIIYMKNMA